MQKSGVRVDCSELNAQLTCLKEKKDSASASTSVTGVGDQDLKIDFNPTSVPKENQSKQIPKDATQVPQSTLNQPNSRNSGKAKDLSALFNAQEASKFMKLEHYPELQQGKNEVVELDELHL